MINETTRCYGTILFGMQETTRNSVRETNSRHGWMQIDQIEPAAPTLRQIQVPEVCRGRAPEIEHAGVGKLGDICMYIYIYIL